MTPAVKMMLDTSRLFMNLRLTCCFVLFLSCTVGGLQESCMSYCSWENRNMQISKKDYLCPIRENQACVHSFTYVETSSRVKLWAEPYFKNDSQRPFLNLTWRVQPADLPKVKGYFLEVNKCDKHDCSGLSKTSTDCFKFNFPRVHSHYPPTAFYDCLDGGNYQIKLFTDLGESVDYQTVVVITQTLSHTVRSRWSPELMEIHSDCNHGLYIRFSAAPEGFKFNYRISVGLRDAPLGSKHVTTTINHEDVVGQKFIDHNFTQNFSAGNYSVYVKSNEKSYSWYYVEIDREQLCSRVEAVPASLTTESPHGSISAVILVALVCLMLVLVVAIIFVVWFVKMRKKETQTTTAAAALRDQQQQSLDDETFKSSPSIGTGVYSEHFQTVNEQARLQWISDDEYNYNTQESSGFVDGPFSDDEQQFGI